MEERKQATYFTLFSALSNIQQCPDHLCKSLTSAEMSHTRIYQNLRTVKVVP